MTSEGGEKKQAVRPDEKGAPPNPDDLSASHVFLIQAAKDIAFDGRASGSQQKLRRGREKRLPSPGDFPGYTVVCEVHRGGQGIVYRAIHDNSGRDVAVKVLHDHGEINSNDRSRFEREAKILAKIDHPNIVAVRESHTDLATPFLVMDYIDGDRLDIAARKHHWSVDETLDVFQRVCGAVGVAHKSGVIHRDLKPGNIMIDRLGEPRILDFGLARVVGPQPGEMMHQTVTTTGQFVGSLPWTSPEQASSSGQKIDLRTDVYSLGVVLFHLLTGEFPYPVTGSVRDVLTNILERPARRPSALRGEVSTDVDTIVLKCLAKDPARRYQTADELAADLARYRANKPILARPSTTAYQLRKLIERNKLPSALAAVIVIGAVAFGAAMGVLYRRADQARLAERAQRSTAEAAEKEALIAAKTAQETTKFLKMLLSTSDPTETRRDLTIRDVLDRGAEKAQSELTDQPEVESSLLDTIGVAYLHLGEYDRAAPVLERSLDLRRERAREAPAELARGLDSYASLLRRQGEYAEAEKLYREALRIRKQQLGDDHPDTLITANNLALVLQARGDLATAEEMFRDIVTRKTELLGPGDRSTHVSRSNLGLVLLARGRARDAKVVFEATLASRSETVGDDHLYTLSTKINLATALLELGENEASRELLEEVLAQTKESLGPKHPLTLSAASHLCDVLRVMRKWKEALALAEPTLRAQRELVGDDHPDTLRTLNVVSLVCIALGPLEKAESTAREGLERARRTFGPGHPETLTRLNNLGSVLRHMGRPEEAEPLMREAVEGMQATFGPRHPNTISALNNLGSVLKSAGRFEEASSCFEQASKAAAITLGADHNTTLTVKGSHASALKRMGDLESAERIYREVLERRIAVNGKDKHETCLSMNNLAKTLEEMGRLEEAADLMTEAVDRLTAIHGPEVFIVATLEGNLGHCEMLRGNYAAARPRLEHAYGVLLAQGGENHKRTKKVKASLDELEKRETNESNKTGTRGEE